MPKSGKGMIKEFIKAGWKRLRQKGSHVTLGKGTARVTIPLHRELKRGLESRLDKTLKEE